MEYGFAKNNQLSMVLLENRSGVFVTPTLASGAAALANMKASQNAHDALVDPVGRDNYPITGLTWIVLKKEYSAQKRVALQDFIKYALTTGQLIAPQLGYLPLPATAVQKSIEILATLK
jgi:phosphate transport system substrate-binding protein